MRISKEVRASLRFDASLCLDGSQIPQVAEDVLGPVRHAVCRKVVIIPGGEVVSSSEKAGSIEQSQVFGGEPAWQVIRSPHNGVFRELLVYPLDRCRNQQGELVASGVQFRTHQPQIEVLPEVVDSGGRRPDVTG